MTDNELRAIVYEVVRAITVEGKHPPTHRRIMAKHRAEWPTLWRALDRLVEANRRPTSADAAPSDASNASWP